MKVGHRRSFRTQMRRNPPPVARQLSVCSRARAITCTSSILLQA
jgi:hypothetical protein